MIQVEPPPVVPAGLFHALTFFNPRHRLSLEVFGDIMTTRIGKRVSFDGKTFKAAEELSPKDKRALNARWERFIGLLHPAERLKIEGVKMTKAKVLRCYLRHASEDLVL